MLRCSIWRAFRATAAFAVIGSGLLTGGAFAAEPAPLNPPQKVKVAYVPIMKFATMYVAAGRGLFKKYGLDVDLEKVKSGTEAIAFLTQGSVDVGGIAIVTSLWNSWNRGLDIRIIAPGALEPMTDSPTNLLLSKKAADAGVKTLAEVVPYRLHGVDLDAGGLKPAALEKAIAETGARVLYTIPTLQNPTTITMTAARRKQIAAIARKRDLLIVEDEAYRAIAAPGDRPPTFTELAPDRTIHVATISKAFSPGLRLGFLRAPTSAISAPQLRTTMSATGPSSVSPNVACSAACGAMAA